MMRARRRARCTTGRTVMVLLSLLSLPIAGACSRTVAAPVGPRRAEPVAPIMMPVSEVRASPSLREIIQHIGDSTTRAPMWSNARWGLLIVDVTTGDTLLSHDADRLFMPASNQKLLTAAVSLTTLGPDYRWRTPVLLRGRQRGDRWIGDLLVVGTGDPTVSDTMQAGRATRVFDPVVAALAARGIRRIQGDVLGYGNAMSGPSIGYGWEVEDLDSPYGAAVDELLFNEGLLTVRVYGGERAGAPVRVVRAPTATYPPLVLEVETRDSVARSDRVRATYDSSGGALVLSGAVGVRDSALLSVSYRHPSDAYRAALREHLAASGIRVTTSLRTATAVATSRPTTSGAWPLDTLAVLESPPLRDVLPRMQKPSQNQIAELLFRTNGLMVSGVGSADSARAVGTRTLVGLGVSPDHLAYRDGSGMSRHDYLTPRAVVQVLDAMRRSPHFDLYRNALPLAGVDGTIANRMQGTAAAGNAQAKTGTVDKARALSGYVTTADGHLVLYSLLCNNFTAANHDVERVQDLLVATLAGAQAGSGGDPRGR